MHRFIEHLRGNAIAYVALFVALGGTSYAATSLPQGSVGTRQLRNGSVTPAKLSHAARTQVAAVTVIGGGGNVVRSTPSAVVTKQWVTLPNGQLGGFVLYPHAFPKTCMPVTTVETPGNINTVGPPTAAAVPVGGGQFSEVQVFASSSATSITLAILCPDGA